MMNLSRYRVRTLLLLASSYLLVSLLTAAALQLLTTNSSLLIYLLVALGAGLIMAFSVTLLMHVFLTKPMELLAQAILHMAKGTTDAARPSLTQGGYAQPLLTELTGIVYDLASGQQQALLDVQRRYDYLKAFVTALPLPTIVLTPDRKIQFHNATAIPLANATIEQLSGAQFNQAFNLGFTSDLTLDNWLDECQASKIQDTHHWERVKVTLSNGTSSYFDLIAHYSKNETHGMEAIICFIDHSERYAADDSQVSFVSLAVHELRAPLTVLRGYIEVFQDELGQQLTDEQRLFMLKMSASASQLATFVNNILNVTRIENDQMKVHPQEEKWEEVLAGAADDFRLRAEVRGRKLTLTVPPDLPTVAVDRVSIYEVLSNLIDNAIKYSPQGGEIIVSSTIKDGSVETSVQDFGIGIPQSIIGNVFDKFYRSHRSRESVGGTGLGLYLAKVIVQGHGGKIWVRSTEGQGSIFTFTVPIYASVAAQLEKTDNNQTGIIRGAHGWIKNHSMYRR